MSPSPAGITPFTLAKKAGDQPAPVLTQWPELLTQLFQDFDRPARWAARQEFELLGAEKAAVEADRNDQAITVSEAAQLLGLRTQTVYEWVKAGKLRALKVEAAVRLKRGHVLAALELQTQPGGRRKYAAARRGPFQQVWLILGMDVLTGQQQRVSPTAAYGRR